MKSTYWGNGKARKPVEIMMTPMIDVVFLLLIFFLTTSSFEMLERMLPSGVSNSPQPIASSATPPPPTLEMEEMEDQVLRVVSNSSGPGAVPYLLEFNGQPYATLPELVAQLRQIVALRADVPVVVDPDHDIAMGDVIEVYDAVRSTGLIRVYMAAR